MRTNLGESTELGNNGTEFGEHNTVYLVTTEAPHGLRPHRCKNQSINQTSSGTATTLIEMAEALKARFYPPMPDADLSDIPNASYLPEIPSPMPISEEEISSVIKILHCFKAAGSDGIPFFLLKCPGSSLVSFLKPLL
jgi:hypothetical protein